MTASLADLLNFSGVTKRDPRADFVGEATIIPMQPSPPEPEPSPPTFDPASTELWSEATMLELIGRVTKGSAFMAEHFYDERGEAQLDRFIEVLERSYLAVTAYRAKKILDA